jgi:serine/threonine-protein kinase
MPERHIGHYLGRFRIDALIGSGGFAWVYKGYDPELDIPVAIKVLKPQFAGEETFEQRFRMEASTAAKLRHPNIVRILAVGREEQAVYFVMDYLATGLDDRLRIMGTLPETLLIRLGLDVSAALAFAHREGVIHRDIKTDNILFDGHGNAVVADFGIARAVTGYTAQTGTNMVVGTPQYFSPEQARGLALDGRADIYSLGVTLFRAATGVLPFQGEDWYEIARQHVEEPPPKPRALNPALSRGAERIILKCLEKDPAERYPAADALHTELVQLYGQAVSPSGEATAVIPAAGTGALPASATLATPPGRRAPRLGTRARGILVLTALVAVVLVGAQARHSGKRVPLLPDSLTALTLFEPDSEPEPPLDSAPEGQVPGTSAPPARILRVVAPAAAEVHVDGRRVGRGSWSGRGLAPGEHRVSAAIAAIPGCPSAREETTVRVTDSGSTEIALSPRPCGTVTLDIIQDGAQWSLTSLSSGTQVASGRAPVTSPIVLPEGTYTLVVEARYCAGYRGDITVAPNTPWHERVRLMCGFEEGE